MRSTPERNSHKRERAIQFAAKEYISQMKNTKRIPVLIDTLSVRFPHEAFMRLVIASQRERRTLSDYVRLLVEEHQRKQG